MNYSCGFVNDFLVSKPKDAKAKLFQFFCSIDVVFYLLVGEMIGTVNFNNQHLFQANKIRNEIVDDMLALKFHSK